MQSKNIYAVLGKLGLATSLLLALGGAASGQEVTLTAAPAQAKLPDGQSVPMWGYTCSAAAVAPATCAPLNANAGTSWSPVLITAPTGSTLTIHLSNSLAFANGNSVPTSLVIVGQLGGGLGGSPTRSPSPEHPHQGTTWPGTPGPVDSPTDCGGESGIFCPPGQQDRVQSFGTEVAPGAATDLTWTNLRPGTYLIESGTHPSIQGPMGLYGVLVVTDPGTAYPGVAYDADLPLLLSEIDPVQNASVAQAVGTAGFSETAVWSGQAIDPKTSAPGCGLPSVHTCYPPAVNYDPRYYLINGVSFDRSALAKSQFGSALNTPASGQLLVRFVNAGLRMHAPSIVGAQTGTPALSGFALIAEDGNPVPGARRVQSEVLLPAGKTFDVMINAPATGGAALPVFDRQLSLSTNNQRDGGMQGYIAVNGSALPSTNVSVATTGETYYCVAGRTLAVTDARKGVLANDVGANGATLGTVTLAGVPPADNFSFNGNGTFTYKQASDASTCGGSFDYIVNGDSANHLVTATITQCDGTAAGLGCSKLGGAPTANADSFPSKVAARLQIGPPGVLENDTDPSGLPLTAALVGGSVSGGTVSLNADGSLVVTPAIAPTAGSPSTVTFQYNAVNAQKRASAAPATASVTFNAGNGIHFVIQDAKQTGVTLDDYRWIIEEDRTVSIDPAVETTDGGGPVRNLAVNFHTSHMPVVATGCTGLISCEAGTFDGTLYTGQTMLDPATGNHVPAVCDVGNGACRPDTAASGKAPVDPSQVVLDPNKRYYISVLPGDAANDTEADAAHTMGGAQISSAQVAAGSATTVNVAVQSLPLKTAKISIYVFQDDFPLNGEADTGGGVDVLAPNEAGLGGFSIVLFDQTGQFGDPAGQLTYDEFGQPVSNALAGKIDPATGLNACAISPSSPDGFVGMIVTCPKYEANPDGSFTDVLSPLAGHAIVANMYPGMYEAHTTPGADRIARGEEWLQTNTLDGTKEIEAFVKADEPAYFQEFGPGGFHIAVGFANPAIINSRKGEAGDGKQLVCSNQTCNATIHGIVTGLRMSRTPDQRVYSSGSYDMYSFAQCYVSLGAPDSADFAFTKCDADGKFTFENVPRGNMKVTVFDQWNDLLVDGLSTPVGVPADANNPNPPPVDVGTAENPIEIAVTQWRTNLYGRIFLDQNGDGASQDEEPGLPLVPYNIRYRDGSYMGFNNTDLAGFAGFNEVFPFLNWLVVDSDSARYKQTGVHVVYDAGGPADPSDNSSPSARACLTTTPPSCGDSTIAAGLANTIESNPVRSDLQVPGARYCSGADCASGDNGGGSTGRVDPGWVPSEGWQGLLGNNSFVEFAMRQFAEHENGGIRGHVIYTSTRPFDDPALLLQLSWEPGVPNVKLNLYKQDTAADGSQTLTLVDTTTTTSWDDWAQGFRRNANGTIARDATGRAIPNMSCPGQQLDSPFYYTMQNSTQALNPNEAIAADGRFKCYDGWSMLDQVQPVPYNGMYRFPSVRAVDPASGANILEFDAKTFGTNCTACQPNHAVPPTDPDYGTPMLPPGKYVVEIVLPPGYELVKEEDKNILLGDVYIAPAEQQFAGFGAIFIMPDQAMVNAEYNPYNAIQATANNNATPRREGDTGSVEVFWPCVGEKRIVPDLNSLFPGAGQQAPFAGATRPLCDRKEVTLTDQMTALAKFYVFTSAHVAGHFTGTITNDFASEFDPFSPQFGEKFAVPNVPVAIRDFSGKEISRVYADQWGLFNGVTYSTWTVNPPSPSGYIPQMMIACMNDPGPIPGPNGTMITDPAYNPGYSNFCYEMPFMPGETAYLDTPVLPTMAFADGYNLPDCEYPDTTPAVASVLGTSVAGNGGGGGSGPWVSGAGQSLTINALGDKRVLNHAYSGPRATTPPYNEKFITRHYGFGDRPSNCPTSGNCLSATIAGVPLTNVTTWTDAQIVGRAPALSSGQSTCTIAQRTSPASLGNSARCGELVITAANGNKSVDTVTVTIGGKPPTYVTPSSPSNALFDRLESSPLQSAVDAAAPGDLILVGPGAYRENLVMWKPVRLQGVGAASVTINADAHPGGKMDAWRRQVNCLFGLTLEGRPSGTYASNGTFRAQTYQGCPVAQFNKVDRNNFEGIVGWDATTNGNLGQLLEEPTLMGAYEGAGITVVGKGVKYPRGADPFALANAGGFPAGTLYLNAGSDCNNGTGGNFDLFDHATSNFLCNPARIDGISVINSSQGGGGIFLHGWQHRMEVSNNRVYANHGTLTGGITVGSGEFADPYIAGSDAPIPFNVPAGTAPGTQLGYGMNTDVQVHHNSVTDNASIGDALYSGTNSAGGGVTFCTGSDRYRFNDNWVCGNLSAGDGGGVVHSGFSNDGTIARNWIIFNQSQSPTIPTNGGGLGVLGAAPDRSFTSGPNAGQECGSVNDLDCPPGLAEGTGRNLTIDANLIMGNSAESGTGGGIRLQLVNGQDVVAFPARPNPITSGNVNNRSPGWNNVTITNNIIANNVAGWDGAGVSMQDALKVIFINNTVVANDTTASAGVLFNTLGAPMSSVPPPGCNPQGDPTQPQDPSCINPVPTSTNQAAGLVTMRHTPNLIAALPPNVGGTQVACPAGFGYGGGGGGSGLNDGNCRSVSLPAVRNDLFWQNRAFHIEVGNLGVGQQDQQSVVTLVPSLNQTLTGACVATGTDNGAPGSGGPASFWDIGVRGDTGPASNASTFSISPSSSILTSFSSRYSGNGNLAPGAPGLISEYCNGARVPPENGGHGYNAPPGRSETTGLYPIFALNQVTAAATVDEGNNWINLGFGPLSLVNPVNGQAVLGNYSITNSSVAINNANSSGAPAQDFFGTSRPQSGGFDIGAVELVLPPAPNAAVSPTSLSFGNQVVNTTSGTQFVTLSNTGTATLTGVNLSGLTPAGEFRRGTGTQNCPTTLPFNLTAGSSCRIYVTFTPSALGARSGSLGITATNATVSGAPVGLSGTGIAAVVSATFTPTTQSFGTVTRGTAPLSAIRLYALNNTGNVTLSSIASPTITLNGTNYVIFPLLTTCGTINPINSAITRITSLAPGNSCAVAVRFQPPLSDAPNSAQTGRVSITNAAGTQSAAMTGTAQ